MAKNPEEMAAAMTANMREKTGKPLGEWLKIVDRAKCAKHGEIVKHLKSEHGVTHGYANMIAHAALNRGVAVATGDDLVATQYSGAKADLRPIYDKLAKAVNKFGQDAQLAPKKAYVSLRRNKQFGLIQPSTKTRIDVGLCLKGVEPTERLEAADSFNSMVSHRVRLTSITEVDRELVGWLKQAYEAS